MCSFMQSEMGPRANAAGVYPRQSENAQATRHVCQDFAGTARRGGKAGYRR
jgi:hypothetical protein